MKHIPQDMRRMETKKKIVDAAMQLFSTKGYYQTNSKEIARDAGVSIGSFYTYFDDKKALLLDMLHTYIQETLPCTIDGDEPRSITEGDRKKILKHIIENSFAFHHFTPGFYQQVTMLSSVDEEIGMVFKEYQDTIQSRIRKFIRNSVPNVEEERLRVACIIAYSAVEGTIHAVKFSGSETESGFFIEELVEFIESYLAGLRGI